MNEFVIDKNKYRVRFQHVIKDRAVNNPDLVAKFGQALRKRKAATVATVERKIGSTPCGDDDCTINHDQWVEVAQGVAFCGKRDNFSKAIGREVALAKLIQGMLSRGAFYLAGRILMALGSDDREAGFVANVVVTVAANKRSGLGLVYMSDEGMARLNVGKLDFD
jgi:hypothetical protein